MKSLFHKQSQKGTIFGNTVNSVGKGFARVWSAVVGLGRRRRDLCDRQRLKFNLPQRQTGKNAVKSGKEKEREIRGKYFEMQAESKQTQRTTDKETKRQRQRDGNCNQTPLETRLESFSRFSAAAGIAFGIL